MWGRLRDYLVAVYEVSLIGRPFIIFIQMTLADTKQGLHKSEDSL